jgi:hypothetical protein
MIKTKKKHHKHKPFLYQKHGQHKSQFRNKSKNKNKTKYNRKDINRKDINSRNEIKISSYTNTYFLVRCPKYKEPYKLSFEKIDSYLDKLGLQTDNAMEQIKKLDEIYLKKNKLSLINYCYDKLDLPKINHIRLRPQFMWLEMNSIQFNKRYYNINAFLVNMLNNDKLDLLEDKYEQFIRMKELVPTITEKYLPNTFKITEMNKYNFSKGKYYILKPIDSFSGKDIIYVSNKKELNNAIEFYKHARNYKNRIYGSDVIAQDYIMNPLLFTKPDGLKYKCHLRVSYMVSYIYGVCNSFMLDDFIRILMAEKAYNLEEPFLHEVHDSHVKGAGDDYNLKADYEKMGITLKDYDNILREIRVIMGGVTNTLIKDKKEWLYDNQENGFYLFGIDVMVTDDLKVKLIECNKGPGYTFYRKDTHEYFTTLFFKWINEVILEPTFKYKDPYISRKHHTYLQL